MFHFYTRMLPIEHTPLKLRHTFHMDVYANYWFDFSSIGELKEILTDESYRHLPKMAIGGGSNLLFLKDYPGMLLHSSIKDIECLEENERHFLIRAGSGINWDAFVETCIQNGWYGLENLSGIPGEIGAGPVQNIGAYGAEAKDFIHSVEVLYVDTLETQILSNEDCQFGYRDSIFKHELKDKCVVCYVTYRLNKHFNPNVQYKDLQQVIGSENNLTASALRDAVLEIRNKKLPNCDEVGNAGSFYTNPIVSRAQFEALKLRYPDISGYEQSNGTYKVSAAWCIDQAGWKGKSLGNAAVHDRQALVLINPGEATSQDILNLSHQIVEDVQAKFGIVLVPEVLMI